MADSNNKPGQNGNGEEHATSGEKHQTEHDAPDAKRTKTDTQTTLDDHHFKSEDKTQSGEKSQPGDDDKLDEKSDEHPKEKQEIAEANKKTEADGNGVGDAVNPAEEPDVPSSILEKGIIYWFIRGRVNIDEPAKVDDIARSFMLLRPIANDARLGEGPIADAGNTRLLVLPKKVLPESGRDRFTVFVEKSGASFDKIKKEFLASNEYETKTAGTRKTPAPVPVGEGIYAITSTGRESHLAYLTTLPEKLDEVQNELGLKEKGSFIISTKNPEFPGPANTQLAGSPDYPKEIQNEFRSLRWMPSKPAHFDYVNSQILLVGESSGIRKAVEPQKEDVNKDKEEPEKVLENLEEDDLKRMKHLGDDQSEAIFADMHVQAKDYPKLQTTF